MTETTLAQETTTVEKAPPPETLSSPPPQTSEFAKKNFRIRPQVKSKIKITDWINATATVVALGVATVTFVSAQLESNAPYRSELISKQIDQTTTAGKKIHQIDNILIEIEFLRVKLASQEISLTGHITNDKATYDDIFSTRREYMEKSLKCNELTAELITEARIASFSLPSNLVEEIWKIFHDVMKRSDQNDTFYKQQAIRLDKNKDNPSILNTNRIKALEDYTKEHHKLYTQSFADVARREFGIDRLSKEINERVTMEWTERLFFGSSHREIGQQSAGIKTTSPAPKP